MTRRHLRYLFLALVTPLILSAADERVVIRGNRHPLASAATDNGAADPATRLDDVTVMLRPSAALEPFLAELQNPRSPNYHKWLTPEQFADRFGLSQSDMDQVTGWLRAEGLQVRE